MHLFTTVGFLICNWTSGELFFLPLYFRTLSLYTNCRVLLALGVFRYLLHYVLSYIQYEDVSMKFFGLALVCLFVGLIGLGKFTFLLEVVGSLCSALLLILIL